MFSPVPYDNGQRPARVFDPVRITLWRPSSIAMGLIGALVLFFAEIFLIRQLINEGLTMVAWARFLLPNVLILPFFLPAAKRSLDRLGYRVKLEEEAMEITLPQAKPLRIAYGEIEQLTVPNGGEVWFRVKPLNREEIVVPSVGLFLRRHHREDVIRVAGARLRPDARLERGDPPDEEQEVERLNWLTLYDPPPVAMEPGKRYRYLPGASAITHLTSMPFSIAFVMPLSIGVSRVTSMIRAGHWSAFEIGFLIFLALSLVGAFLYVKNWWRNDDLFEAAADGLWVIRGNRRFKVTNPQPVYPPYSSLAPVKRPILRYGRGWNAFYFDPRFIEEDIPEPWAEEDP
jgi:hypothetical protein